MSYDVISAEQKCLKKVAGHYRREVGAHCSLLMMRMQDPEGKARVLYLDSPVRDLLVPGQQ